MELIRGLHNLAPRHRGCVATIGAFDGIHLGHQAVLSRLLETASALSLPSTVILFEPLPREYFSPGDAPARLMSFKEKLRFLDSMGIDRILRIKFSPEFRKMGARDFIDSVFVRGLGVKHIIVGDDFRFGADRIGNYLMLKEVGAVSGFDVVDTDTLALAQERVSSTRIRQALDAADFSLAESLLGRPYSMSGKVVYGQQLGRTLGIPTANLLLHRHRSPMAGVYAVEVLGIGQGVANVGTRPTVGDLTKAILEVHLFDFDGHMYGKNIEVIFRKKIREEKKFASLEELKNQIRNDIEFGKTYFNECKKVL